MRASRSTAPRYGCGRTETYRRLATVLLTIMLLLAPFAPVRQASAANASLVMTALNVLERGYVDPVQPVQLLNAGIAMMRKVTNSSADVLPDIPAGTPEEQASMQFMSEFSKAAQALPPGITETQFAYATTQGMLLSLNDSHTYYLDPEQFQEAERQVSGTPSFTGIGVEITAQKDSSGVQWVFVATVFPGSPAAQAGIKRFDRIVSVDGRSLKDATAVEVSQLIRGLAGTVATLVVQRGDQTVQIPVTRTREPTAMSFMGSSSAGVRPTCGGCR